MLGFVYRHDLSALSQWHDMGIAGLAAVDVDGVTNIELTGIGATPQAMPASMHACTLARSGCSSIERGGCVLDWTARVSLVWIRPSASAQC